ncbi:MAG: hypothetical protein HRU78_07850 [Gammaproteobacteria bacterium]|nr:MAG: hypothetical protein HRU78_07850 [Gammaproteobacteria bacterium]
MLHGITPCLAIKNRYPDVKRGGGTVQVDIPGQGSGEPFGSPHSPPKTRRACINGQKNSRLSGLSALSSGCQTRRGIWPRLFSL